MDQYADEVSKSSIIGWVAKTHDVSEDVLRAEWDDWVQAVDSGGAAFTMDQVPADASDTSKSRERVIAAAFGEYLVDRGMAKRKGPGKSVTIDAQAIRSKSSSIGSPKDGGCTSLHAEAVRRMGLAMATQDRPSESAMDPHGYDPAGPRFRKGAKRVVRAVTKNTSGSAFASWAKRNAKRSESTHRGAGQAFGKALATAIADLDAKATQTLERDPKRSIEQFKVARATTVGRTLVQMVGAMGLTKLRVTTSTRKKQKGFVRPYAVAGRAELVRIRDNLRPFVENKGKIDEAGLGEEQLVDVDREVLTSRRGQRIRKAFAGALNAKDRERMRQALLEIARISGQGRTYTPRDVAARVVQFTVSVADAAGRDPGAVIALIHMLGEAALSYATSVQSRTYSLSIASVMLDASIKILGAYERVQSNPMLMSMDRVPVGASLEPVEASEHEYPLDLFTDDHAHDDDDLEQRLMASAQEYLAKNPTLAARAGSNHVVLLVPATGTTSAAVVAERVEDSPSGLNEYLRNAILVKHPNAAMAPSHLLSLHGVPFAVQTTFSAAAQQEEEKAGPTKISARIIPLERVGIRHAGGDDVDGQVEDEEPMWENEVADVGSLKPLKTHIMACHDGPTVDLSHVLGKGAQLFVMRYNGDPVA